MPGLRNETMRNKALPVRETTLSFLLTLMVTLTGTLLVALFILSAPARAQSASDTPVLTEEQVQQIVRDYILENPEVIIEAVQSYRAKQKLAEEQQRTAALVAKREEIFNDPLAPTNGVTDADVTIVEFFDYQCGYCKKIFPDMMAVMAQDKKIKVVFKELPILGPESVVAARAALAAKKQGKYMDFHVALMDLRGSLSEKRILQTAEEVGLDAAQLAADMDDPEIGAYLRANLELANQVGINGTPSLFVGETFVPGYIDRDTLVSLIAKAREANGKSG